MVLAGVGLICGSLGSGHAPPQAGQRDRSVTAAAKTICRSAKKKGLIDSYFLREDDFPADVDFLMIGTPVETIVPLTQSFLPKLEKPVVSSAMSAASKARSFAAWKSSCRSIFRLSPAIRSPAANNGARRRRGANLFVRHRCVLTPTAKTDKKALEKSRGAVAPGRRRCRDHGSRSARPVLGRDQPSAPRVGLRAGECARPDKP